MNWKTLGLSVVLVAFGLLSAHCVEKVGYLGIWQAGIADWGALQILTDLVVVCSLAAVWMIADARTRGLNPWPYVAVTLVAGSVGPLAYLLRREWRARRLVVHAA